MFKEVVKIIVIVLVAVSLLFIIPVDEAKAIGLGTPFGGRVTSVIPCVAQCPPSSMLVTVGLPRPGVFLYTPGVSRLLSYFKLLPGSWVLGLTNPAGIIIQMVGTSGF